MENFFTALNNDYIMINIIKCSCDYDPVNIVKNLKNVENIKIHHFSFHLIYISLLYLELLHYFNKHLLMV